MSDCSPLRLAENGNSSPNQSLGSQHSEETNRRDATSRNNRPGPRVIDQRVDGAGHPIARARSHSESSSKSVQLRYGAKNVIELFVPVSLCMLMVVGIMKATDSYNYSSQSAIWYAQMMFTDQTVDTGTRVWQSFANALIMLVMIVIMTTVLIVLYKLRCYATIHGWLIISSLMLLFIFATVHVTEILKVYNIPLDIFTLAISLWNFGVVGMICIHWKGPLLLQQGYLITISAFMALIFIQCLPDWTIWTVLGIVSIWDLVAVLAPRGPLRILVETAQERNESIFPALIYSSTMLWEVIITGVGATTSSISMAEVKSGRDPTSARQDKRSERDSNSRRPNRAGRSSSSSTRSQILKSSPVKRDQHPVEIHYEDTAETPEVEIIQPNLNLSTNSEVDAGNWQRPTVRAVNEGVTGSNDRDDNRARSSVTHVDESQEERGVKLGLGDFIFYSVLVGKASTYGDWTITLSCYVSILVGLSVTLSLLAVLRKALPALPISIAFGMCSFFLSSLFVVPFSDRLAVNQVFV